MGRLSKYQFLVLAALLRRPMHPYAIRDEIIQISGDRLWPRHTTVYKALHALKELHLVREGAEDSYYWLKARRSTPFTITPQGRLRVRRELSIYHSVVLQSWNRLEKDGI